MTAEIITLCIAAFAAGFIDSIVGGGGLVQTPAVLITLPQYPVATLLGTTKIPSFCGTAIASYQYAKKVPLQWKLLLIMCSIALLAAITGSYTVTVISNHYMKPVIFCVLILVAVYTYTKKNFGTGISKNLHPKPELLYGSLFALAIGFYDGFIGPGAGSFLVLFFIGVLGFDFLKASAHAKFVNLATNVGSIIYFGGSGHILFHFAIPMALFNFTGSFIGAKVAIVKGNQFIRVFFLLVIAGIIIRFGYDIFFK
jgi:uncharacterized protein